MEATGIDTDLVGHVTTAEVPLAGRIVTMCLSLITISVLAVCLIRRLQFVRNWSTLPFVSYLILAIYVDSLLFIFSTAVLEKTWSLNSATPLCQAAILLCLTCYMSTKIMIYYFLVEKVYIVRGSTTGRFGNRLWKFNVFGVILPYAVLVVVNFVFRVGYINKSGVCIIGMEGFVLWPLIGFDVALNVYLTSLFLAPLYQLYSFKTGSNPALRTVAIRTFVGSCTTLVSSIANLSVLAVLHGEPGWLCLMLCNLDILLCVLVLHWATSIDRQKGPTEYNSPYGVGDRYAQNSRNLNNSRRGYGKEHGGLEPEKDDIAISTKIVGGAATPAPGSDEEQAMKMHGIHVRTVQIQELEYKRAGSAPLPVQQPRTPSSDKSGSEEHILQPVISRKPDTP